MSDFPLTDNNEISTLLEDLNKLPLLIQQAESALKEAQDVYRKSVLAYDYAYNKAFITAAGPVAEREALATINSMDKAQEKLAAQSALGLAEVKYNHQMNTWLSLKKEAGLAEARLKQSL